MTPKGPSELTLDEIKLLSLAAKLLAALRSHADAPPPASDEKRWATMVQTDIKAVGVIYRRYAKIIKKPRVHPVIQIMATEWRRLESLGSSPPNWEKGLPIWGNVTVSMVETACKAVAVKNPDWHADLSAQDISQYLRDVSAAKRWWIPGSKGDEDVAMADAAAAPPSEPSDPAPPTRSSKGKGRQIQEDIPAARPATPPYALRASKRHKPSIVSPEIIADEETTPRKADAPSGKDIPRVEIEQASPPARPTPPPPIAKVAVGDGRCGPCKTSDEPKCVSQAGAARFTTACELCHKRKKTCFPMASWLKPFRELLSAEASGSEESSIGFQGLADRLDVLADLMEAQANRQDVQDHRIEVIDFNMKKMLLLLNALCEHQGIDLSSIPGINDPPPHRRSLSPHSPSAPSSVHSAPSTGLGISSLALSDAHSSASAHSSVSKASSRASPSSSALSAAPSAGSSHISSAARK